MASGSSNASPWPASILLAKEGYNDASTNDTTARARSKDGHTMEITIWIADPPAASFYTFRCIKNPNSDSKDVNLGVYSVIAGAHGRFLLIRAFVGGLEEPEYFVYKGHPKSPSLEGIPPAYHMLRNKEFGIVPRGDDGHYLLVAVSGAMMRMNDYLLHVYSSEDTTWSADELPNPRPVSRRMIPDKVFTLGDGLVLWVDLILGILTCDVFQEPPFRARYIPLPEPLPGNRERVKKYLPGVRCFRDLTCVDGLIRFVEIENRETVREIADDVPPEKPFDPRTRDVLYDSELFTLSCKHKPVQNKPKIQRSNDGWSAIVWTRELGSDFWLKGSVVDANDILVDDSIMLSALLSSGDKSEPAAGSLMTFKNLLYAVSPTLSTDGNDILYIKLPFNRQLGLSVLSAVDLVDKTLKLEAPEAHIFVNPKPSGQILLPCALANHLKMTPGIKVSASHQFALIGSSANEPNSTAIRVGERDSYEPENKRPRLSAGKVSHAQNADLSTVQNVLTSQAHPNQNNMPPRLCFNRYKQPGYSGYSSWPHKNNLLPPPTLPPPPRSFNKWAGGSYKPVYAPSAPAPNIQSYPNYQSLPQQPLLEQQSAPSMAFGPRMAQPIYTSTTGMEPAPMGIDSSTNPYAYGAHPWSGIYHQR